MVVGTLYEETDTPVHVILIFRPNKKISVFWVTGLKILCREGTHNSFIYFFLEFFLFLFILPFKMHKIRFFQKT